MRLLEKFIEVISNIYLQLKHVGKRQTITMNHIYTFIYETYAKYIIRLNPFKGDKSQLSDGFVTYGSSLKEMNLLLCGANSSLKEKTL